MKYLFLFMLIGQTLLFSKQQFNNNKMELIFLKMEYCPWCQKMEKEIFSNDKVKNRLKKYYTIKEYSKAQLRNTNRKLKTNFYPTTFILSHDGKIIDKLIGYINPKEFVDYTLNLYELENIDN